MVFVTKADGRKQEFIKEKVVRTCLRMHASHEIAHVIANKIESKIYEGIQTKEILKMIFNYLKQYKPEIGHQIDLREAISLLRSKPDFELFISYLLRQYGYSVLSNQIILGKCIDHEIDAIAQKGNEKIYVEVKHHLMHHTYTGIGVFLEAWATFEDLKEGFKLGKNNFDFNKVLVVCNTKISDHAKQYAECKDIQHIGWRYPFDNSLEQMLEEKKLYPITILKNLDRESEEKFGDRGIVLLKQLLDYNVKELAKKTGISRDKIENFIKRAKNILK
jgi:hypothetical protein